MLTRSVLFLLLLWMPAGSGWGHSLAELKPLPHVVPEPAPGETCQVPPIPSGDDYFKTMRAEGWNLDRGRLWREWNVNGRRYFIEYGIRSNDGKAIVPSVFPYQYSFDMNRNGTFEVPGEVFVDIKGDGRCSDLQPVFQLASDRPA